MHWEPRIFFKDLTYRNNNVAIGSYYENYVVGDYAHILEIFLHYLVLTT